MARIFKGVSIVIHAIVIGTISYIQVFDPGLLPSPQSVLAYQIPIAIRESPRPPSPPRAPQQAQDLRNVAPIAPPDRLPTGPEPDPAPTSREPGVKGGIDDLGSGAMPFGIVDNLAPAPPLPPPAPPPPLKPVHLGGNIRPPVKVLNVDPIYPDIARAARKEGIVILEVVIAVDGRVESVRVLRGVPMLDQAAVTAVQQWRFEPARLNDQVVPVVMTVTVNFLLSK